MRSRSVGRKGGNRPDTPGHWRGRGCRERRREAGGADGGTEEGVGGGGPGGRAGGARTRRRAPSERWVWVRSGNGGTQTRCRHKGQQKMGGGGVRLWPREGHELRLRRGGWAWAAEGRHWRPSTRQENGPPAAEGRPWGRLNLRGGPEATHPQGRKRKGEGERQCSGGGRSWARTIERGAQGGKGAPKHAQTCARADTHVQRHPRARARASPRGAGGKRDGQVAAQTWRKRCRRQRRRRSPRPSRRRRGPGTRSGRVVDVREARERVTTGRGVERGRPASAGRRAQAGPESCDPGATHLGVPRALAEGPMATACGVPSRARRPGAREGGNRAGARRGGRQGPRTGSPAIL